MNILRAYKRTRFFLWINIIGLAVGLASSCMLILFAINELSYDKNIPDSDRIISLNTVMEMGGEEDCLPITTRRALTDIPLKVPGIEAATQIYGSGEQDLKYEEQDYRDIPALMTEPGFCDVFSVRLPEGSKDALNVPGRMIISEKYANIIFGGSNQAMNKTLNLGDTEYTIAGVMADWPSHTHFRAELLISMDEDVKTWPSIEFFTFYKIKEGVSLDDVRTSIEKEYTVMVQEFLKGFGGKSYGVTEKFTDIYLKTKARSTLDKRSSMQLVQLLIGIGVFILLLAVINFINLFIAQGETRMLEIGVRKANGATLGNIIRQYFSEILIIVFIAFVIGFVLLVICIPYFAELINREIELTQLYNPIFILCVVLLFAVTVILSASYPTFYLGRFKTLDILTKKVRFSKRRLTAVSISFQAMISIIIISFILVVTGQINFLRKQPLGYNPENVLVIRTSRTLHQEYDAFRQELEKKPGILQVSMAHHTFGGGASGQGISLLGETTSHTINEYRIHTGICEMLKLQLAEGEFYKENDETNKNSIILNEAAIKMLGLRSPVIGTTIDYKGNKEIKGVVKDFYFGKIENKIEPMVLTWVNNGGSIYIKYANGINRNEIQKSVREVIDDFDSLYILNPIWLEDVYTEKFESLDIQSRLLKLASFLSIFISMIGLLAIHMLSAIRRKKEIGIRRVNGADQTKIFTLLSAGVLILIVVAGMIAIPVVYYFASDWLNNYTNRIALSWTVFVLPVVLQCIIALIVTSGVSIKALMENPVEVLKAE